jgi:hypothetical protein
MVCIGAIDPIDTISSGLPKPLDQEVGQKNHLNQMNYET